jgi:hypothetical protein
MKSATIQHYWLVLGLTRRLAIAAMKTNLTESPLYEHPAEPSLKP